MGNSAKNMHALDTEALWDEGIASFLADQYALQNAPLTSAHLQRMANEHAVRIGDMLETLFLMSIYGAWHYCRDNGDPQELDEAALDELYAKGRIGPEDMKQFDGVWIPSI